MTLVFVYVEKEREQIEQEKNDFEREEQKFPNSWLL